MLEVCNHLYFTRISKNKFLEKYQYIVFDTNDIETAKKIFEIRFLKNIPKIKLRRKAKDPIVSYYQKLGYNISYTFNSDFTENYDSVIIEVPSIDINDFEFLPVDNINNRDKKEIIYISKYQILWDKIYLETYENIYKNYINKED